MPSFAKLRQEGAYARLISAKPLLSPIIWTTIATGKPPDQHRIGHFVAVNAKTGEQLPVTSRMRKVKALWNILSDAGRSVAVVGWWATWPAEDVRGTVVSDHTCYHFLFDEGATGGADLTGTIYPPALEPAPMSPPEMFFKSANSPFMLSLCTSSSGSGHRRSPWPPARSTPMASRMSDMGRASWMSLEKRLILRNGRAEYKHAYRAI